MAAGHGFRATFFYTPTPSTICNLNGTPTFQLFGLVLLDFNPISGTFFSANNITFNEHGL